MKLTSSLVSLAIIFSVGSVSFLGLPASVTAANDDSIALQRGYRTGYSDGYMAGYRDSLDNAAKDYTRHPDYDRADRAYNKDYGSVGEYKDGYRQGFESGYEAGFAKQTFEAAIPATLAPRGESQAAGANTTSEPASVAAAAAADNIPASGAVPIEATAATSAPAEIAAAAPSGASETAAAELPASEIPNSPINSSGDVIVLPRDTELIIELQDELSTEGNKEGDKFTGRVVSPAEVSGAIVEGRVEKIQKPGRIKRRSQMLLSFDRIVVSESRWSNFDAILTEVLPVKGDNVRRVDAEGSAIGKSTVKSDGVKVGAATGTGAGIGAIAGGPVGAAVGAGVGAAIGVGAVAIEKGRHIKLNRSQQLRIKSSYETKIR